MYRIDVHSIRNTWVAAGVLLFAAAMLFLVFPFNVHAAGAYGWFAPVAAVSGQDSACGPEKAVLDVSLREHSSEAYVSDPTGLVVEVRTLSKATNQIVDSVTSVMGTLTSPTICFDPINHRIQAKVTTTVASSYQPFQSVSVALSVLSPMEALKGQRVAASVHLAPLSQATPNIEYVYPPAGVMLNADPTYLVKTNLITPVYSSNSVISTMLYVKNVDTSTVYTGLFPTVGASGTFPLTLGAALGSGYYRWYFYQNLNGRVTTTIGSLTADFDGLPLSSLTTGSDFRIDAVAPFHTLYRKSSSTSPTQEVFTVYSAVRDLFGIASTTITVVDNDTGTLVADIQCDYGSPAPLNSVRYCYLYNLALDGGVNYTITAVAEDAAGNLNTQIQTFTVALVPVVGNLSAVTGTDVATTTAEIITVGMSPVTERGFCLSNVSLWATLTNASTNNCQVAAAPTAIFESTFTGLTPGVYWYRAYAVNAEGTGYSIIRPFSIGSLVVDDTDVELATSCIGENSRVTVHATATDATQYRLRYCTGVPCIATTTPVIVLSTFMPYAYNWLPQGTSTTFQVAAYNQADGWLDYVTIGTVMTNVCLAVAQSPIIFGPNMISGDLVVPATVPATRQATATAFLVYTGGADITERGTCWGMTQAEGWTDNCLADSATSSGLFEHTRVFPEGTTVWVSAYAINESGLIGTTTSAAFFVGAVAPTLSGSAHVITSQSSAIIGANIDSDGGAPILRRGTRWCSGSACVPTNVLDDGGTATGYFSQSRTGLPLGVIRYLSYAQNANGLWGFTEPIGEFTLTEDEFVSEVEFGTDDPVPQ